MAARKRRRGPLPTALRTLFVLFVLLVLLVAAPWAYVQLSSRDRINPPDQAPADQVGLVLGAALWNGRPSPYLQGRLRLMKQPDVIMQRYLTAACMLLNFVISAPVIQRKYLRSQNIFLHRW